MAPDPSSKAPVTQLLHAWSRGDRAALDQLVPLVHDDLRRLASRRERQIALASSGTLQATALVNEVYLKLVHAGGIEFRDRAHFFAISATLMRQILIDAARSRSRDKRGGGWQRVSLHDGEMGGIHSDGSLLELDQAMDRLAQTDARKARVVELRFFGGMTNDEIAEVLGVSADTVKRDWAFAKLWLARELKTGAAD
jgi:RNA polymerase sigma-70 factor (ECF subfamily)